MNQKTERQTEHQPTEQRSRNGGQAASSEAVSIEKPTEAQKAYIVDLGRRVGLRIDVENIADRNSASRTIRCLRVLDLRMNGFGRSRPSYSRLSDPHDRFTTTHIKDALTAMRG